MSLTSKLLILTGFLLALAMKPLWADEILLPERALGKADAPITMHEFVSLTCSHCAEFYTKVLPEVEKNYVDTGKVRVVFHDFPLDGNSLKAATLARCMPEEQFFPYIKMLYKNQGSWAANAEAEKIIRQYAKLGGLSDDKAKACLQDTKLQDAIVAERTYAQQTHNVEATPTFVIISNEGAEQIRGAQPYEKFSVVFDKLLALKH